MALTGWQMSVFLELILGQFADLLWGSKSVFFIVIIMLFAHMREPATEEKKKLLASSTEGKKLKSADNSTWLTG